MKVVFGMDYGLGPSNGYYVVAQIIDHDHVKVLYWGQGGCIYEFEKEQ